ncbi:polyphosphate--glucose phosphotransferase [Homoserinibacter sp. YIM 151385]|uniref:polyphosphate--glucose phosphotransferase n=1 Tax=Homoserinibacter sp. YIM 151385 TaxID=2985506 RepID=UPI0022F08E74|nr:ROK family protein [Homoserinibacter sp. YIM 151385]WBU38468.1 ROK family protein [Homoserinibacter sp. YIM 151385]
MTDLAIGIDIGGTGIKGAVVDLATGELATDRIKRSTPEGGKPDDIVEVVVELVDALAGEHRDAPVGVCFPAIVLDGRTMSAANVDDAWIGLEAEALFEKALGRDIHFVNDADAAGVAELRYGAAKGREGLVLMTTLGTGIGSALINRGVLVPNTELGHLEVDGKDAEKRAAYIQKERHEWSWEQWAKRLQRYYSHLELLFSPDLFVVGGGVSKHHEEFLPLLDLRTPIIPATLRNNAGILGAAALAVKPAPVA